MGIIIPVFLFSTVSYEKVPLISLLSFELLLLIRLFFIKFGKLSVIISSNFFLFSPLLLIVLLHVYVLNVVIQSLSCVWLFCDPIVHHAPLSMGFPRQEYWKGLSFPSPGDLPNPGITSRPSEPPGEPLYMPRVPHFSEAMLIFA